MCHFPELGYPIPRFSLGQRVEVRGLDEVGIVSGFAFNPLSSEPGYHYFIRFETPRAFEDEIHEQDLEERL